MENFVPENIEANDVNIQCGCDRDRDRDRVGGRVERRPEPPCVHDRDRVAGAKGIDSSLLFFFLILVAIVCQSDCDIELDTLLWFFLLLVVLFNKNFF